MKKLLLLAGIIHFNICINANTVIVKNAEELKKANKEASPGDIIVLQDGVWNDISIALNCKGTESQPITFKSQTAGKVIISGKSKLQIGGTYLIIDGLYFTNGYAGDDEVIKFRVNEKELANHCRVTNTVINGFNNPERLDQNYWIALYGKNNRVDHCQFQDKKNMGVMLAVILDDERSRENFHSIDHNYFGFRKPLASNTGETIRVGVSQHCQFNSNTQITDNYFEHCDGETEIISIKSGSNVIRGNLFKECQGAVVLRHGDNNTVENNIFLGNDKVGTGGVRVINKGQWVVNNYFYKCRGTGFRSPLAVMNGVPNSPANRYVAVTDAVIANNTYIDCTSLSFCDGSDTERSLPPSNTFFINNIFYNTIDSVAYKTYDDVSKITFIGNAVSTQVSQTVLNGFTKNTFSDLPMGQITMPTATAVMPAHLFDSLSAIGRSRLSNNLSTEAGFKSLPLYNSIINNAKSNTGTTWFSKTKSEIVWKNKSIKVKNAQQLIAILGVQSAEGLRIKLTRKKYDFEMPININTNVSISGKKNKKLTFTTSTNVAPFLFQVKAGNTFKINNLQVNLSGTHLQSFISTDTSGRSNHLNIQISNCSFSGLQGDFLRAAKTSVADNISIFDNNFENNEGILFRFNEETDKKGYYNVEKFVIAFNEINQHKGAILLMARTGNDESTMGPDVLFFNNSILNSNTADGSPLIFLYGTQKSEMLNNQFNNSNLNHTLIKFEDIVRASHILKNNSFTESGSVEENEFTVVVK